MNERQQFLGGIAGIGLGNGLLASSYFLDRSLLGPFTTMALVGASLAVVGTIIVLAGSYASAETFEFEDAKRPRLVLLGGFGTILAGLVNLSLVVTG